MDGVKSRPLTELKCVDCKGQCMLIVFGKEIDSSLRTGDKKTDTRYGKELLRSSGCKSFG